MAEAKGRTFITVPQITPPREVLEEIWQRMYDSGRAGLLVRWDGKHVAYTLIAGDRIDG